MTTLNRRRIKKGTYRNTQASLLTVREARRLLNVTDHTLRKWDKLGMLKAYHIGPRGDRRFRQADVAALLFSQTQELRAPAIKLSCQ